MFRNSRSQMFFKKDFLKNFAIFTPKNLCCSLFFTKPSNLKVCNFIRKKLQHCFAENFTKFLRTAFLQNTSGSCFRLLPFFSGYQISQLNCKFKGLALTFRMTLLMKIMLAIVEESFLTLIKCKYMFLNVGIEFPICEANRQVFPCLNSNLDLF